MTIPITFLSAAVEDLDRLDRNVVALVLSKLQMLQLNPLAGHPLGGSLTGFRKLVVGNRDWRIVYRVLGDEIEVCEVWAVGARADSEIYAEVGRRLKSLGTNPVALAVGEIIERLGPGATLLASAAPIEPPPTWLVDRLVHTAGVERDIVQAMPAERAMELWERFITGQP